MTIGAVVEVIVRGRNLELLLALWASDVGWNVGGIDEGVAPSVVEDRYNCHVTSSVTLGPILHLLLRHRGRPLACR